MAEIKVEVIHLAGASDKGGMPLGKTGLIMAPRKHGYGPRLELAGRRPAGTVTRQRGQPEKTRHQPGRAVTRGLPVRTALSPLVAQRRQRALVQPRFRQQRACSAVHIVGLACRERNRAAGRAFGKACQITHPRLRLVRHRIGDDGSAGLAIESGKPDKAASRPNGRRQAAGPRGYQEQHCPFGRFFQKLQQGVCPVAVHEVHGIDDGDTPAAPAGLVAEKPDELSDLVELDLAGLVVLDLGPDNQQVRMVSLADGFDPGSWGSTTIPDVSARDCWLSFSRSSQAAAMHAIADLPMPCGPVGSHPCATRPPLMADASASVKTHARGAGCPVEERLCVFHRRHRFHHQPGVADPRQDLAGDILGNRIGIARRV